MALEFLFAFFYTEDPDSLLCEPFDYERSFIIPASQAVKHEYQKDIKPFIHGIIAKFLDGIPVFRRHLETGYSLLTQFLDNRPALRFGKLAALNINSGRLHLLNLILFK